MTYEQLCSHLEDHAQKAGHSIETIRATPYEYAEALEHLADGMLTLGEIERKFLKAQAK